MERDLIKFNENSFVKLFPVIKYKFPFFSQLYIAPISTL